MHIKHFFAFSLQSAYVYWSRSNQHGVDLLYIRTISICLSRLLIEQPRYFHWTRLFLLLWLYWALCSSISRFFSAFSERTNATKPFGQKSSHCFYIFLLHKNLFIFVVCFDSSGLFLQTPTTTETCTYVYKQGMLHATARVLVKNDTVLSHPADFFSNFRR